MGIKGLLKYIKDIETEINIKEIMNSTVAIDGHSWLHKSLYNNGYEILIKKNLNKIISYFENKIEIFLKYNIKCILVFDGDNHILKNNTNNNRYENRKNKKKLAFESLMKRNKYIANKQFSECIDVTPEHTYYVCNFIKEKYNSKKEVDYIISPYEADSQLAYLNRNNFVDYVITEDSDLLLFGANNILFKMDSKNNFKFIKRENVLKYKEFDTQEKLINICILSGCDYLQNPKGIGLKKSIKLFNEFETIENIIEEFNNKGIQYEENYLEKFNLSFLAFFYSKVFCPENKKMVFLNKLNFENLSENHENKIKKALNFNNNLEFLGKELSKEILLEIAQCKRNPITKLDFNTKRKIENSIILNKINFEQKLKEFGIKNNNTYKLQKELKFKKLIITDKEDYISNDILKIIDYNMKFN